MKEKKKTTLGGNHPSHPRTLRLHPCLDHHPREVVELDRVRGCPWGCCCCYISNNGCRPHSGGVFSYVENDIHLLPNHLDIYTP